METDAAVIHPDTGRPQGGTVSPVLANVYLHYAPDLWFDRVVKSHCRGEAMMYRYADDWVCAFRYRGDAERFYRVRLGEVLALNQSGASPPSLTDPRVPGGSEGEGEGAGLPATPTNGEGGP